MQKPTVIGLAKQLPLLRALSFYLNKTKNSPAWVSNRGSGKEELWA
jgi:hypothetical protein